MVTIVKGGGGIGTAERYPVLDSLRGLAALGVVFHHIPVSEALAVARWDDNFNLLLDLFFVISGFVIAAAYAERMGSGFPLRRFLWLRLGRIWPLHAAMLCVFILSMLALGVLRPDLRTHGLMAGRHDPADLPAAFLLLQGIVPSLGPVWNDPSWSISVEMLLYVLAALGWRAVGQRAWIGWLVAALVLLALTTFDSALQGTGYNVARGISGFGLGLFVHAVLSRVKCTPSRAQATALEALALLALVLVVGVSGNLVLFDSVAACLVALAVLQRGWISELLAAQPFQVLGTLSYALYLSHVFVIGRVFDVLEVVQPRLGVMIAQTQVGGQDMLVGPDARALLAKLAIVALCLLVAWPFATLIEQPARAWSRRVAGIPARKAAI